MTSAEEQEVGALIFLLWKRIQYFGNSSGRASVVHFWGSLVISGTGSGVLGRVAFMAWSDLVFGCLAPEPGSVVL